MTPRQQLASLTLCLTGAVSLPSLSPKVAMAQSVSPSPPTAEVVPQQSSKQSSEQSSKQSSEQSSEQALEQADQLRDQAIELFRQAQYAEAVPLVEEALAIREQILGPNNIEVGLDLFFLARLYDQQTLYAEALPLYERALAIHEAVHGENHVDVAGIVRQIGFLYRAQGDYAAALPFYERALAIYEVGAGADSLEVARSLTDLASLQVAQGNYDAALPLYERALAIQEEALGPDHLDITLVLNNLASWHRDQGNYTTALPLYERALAIREKALGATHPDVANSLNNLADLYLAQGEADAALPLFERSRDIYRTEFGENHPRFADSLSNLAVLYHFQGDYGRAVPLLEQALGIYEAALGENHPTVAILLNNLAELSVEQARFDEAIVLFERALAIQKGTVGENHPKVAVVLHNLGSLYKQQGNYPAAIAQYESALAIRETTLGKAHPDVANSLNGLAAVYMDQGNYKTAQPLLEQALAIQETALGATHPDLAFTLNDLALLHQKQGDHDTALPLYERARSIREAALDALHPDLASLLNNMAVLYQEKGDYPKAQTFLERSLEIWQKVFGEPHPLVATGLNNLGLLAFVQGDYAAGGPYAEQAAVMVEATLGDSHPILAKSLSNLVDLHWVNNDMEKAIAQLTRVNNIEEQNFSESLLGASELRQQYYLNALTSPSVNISAHLQAAPNNPQAATLALTTILRRKGRSLDAAADTAQQLRKQLSPAEQSQFDELNEIRATLSDLRFNQDYTLTNDSYQQLLAEAQAKAQALEKSLSQTSEAFRTEAQPISVETVQPLIPSEAALVEIVHYSPYNPERPTDPFDNPRYAAYVLTRQGTVQAVDLGDAAEIDQMAAEFRRYLGAQGNMEVISQALYSQLIAPMTPLLQGKTQLLISPDSQLNLIPFEALMDEQGRYLVESYQISYLTSGRDLLRLQGNNNSVQPPVVVGNPDYNRASEASPVVIAANGTESPRSGDGEASLQAERTTFQPFKALPATQTEVEAIAQGFANATVLTDTAATESALKQVQAPSILHLATHGFFLPDRPFELPTNRRQAQAITNLNALDAPTQVAAGDRDNPLLQSGLVFAGANSNGGRGENGILTALEATGLNLQGTQLVVLSACETGLGEATAGKGVYGLRRAFVIAGAQSQLTSLWIVNDTGTSALMQAYYNNLQGGQGRGEALRTAQLAMLEDDTFDHPYFWSSFVLSGDWRPVDGV